jgi:hypothetical protein
MAVETPESQVFRAPGRVSLVGTPTRLVNPKAVASAEVAQLSQKENLRAERELKERLYQQKADLTLQGSKILNSARAKALEQADPEKVVETYEGAIGTSLEETRNGLSDDRDVAEFDIQMGRRMGVHQLTLDRHRITLRRRIRLAGSMAFQEELEQTTQTDDPATVSLAIRELQDRADGDLEAGVDPAMVARYMAILPEKFELNHVNAMLESAQTREQYENLIDYVKSPEQLPNLSAATRLAVVDQIKSKRSERVFTEISVAQDQGIDAMIGDSGQALYKKLWDEAILSDSHYRQLSNRNGSISRRVNKDTDSRVEWQSFVDTGIFDVNSPTWDDAVNIGFSDFAAKKSAEDSSLKSSEIAEMFAREHSFVAPAYYGKILSQVTNADENTASETAQHYLRLNAMDNTNMRDLAATKGGANARRVADYFGIYLWGQGPLDMKRELAGGNISEQNKLSASGVLQNAQTLPTQQMDPIQAIRAARQAVNTGDTGDAALAARRLNFSTVMNGSVNAMNELAFDYMKDHIKIPFGAQVDDWEDAPPQWIRAMLSLAQEEFVAGNGLDNHEVAFNAAGERFAQLGYGFTEFSGEWKPTREPIERYVNPAIHPATGVDLGLAPMQAELNVRVVQDTAQAMEGASPELAILLDQTAQEFINDEVYANGGHVGQGELGTSYVKIKPTMSAVIEKWAEKAGIGEAEAWYAFNTIAFGGNAPGAVAWEPELEGDQLTSNNRQLSGEQGPAWAVVAFLENNSYRQIITPRHALGMHMTMQPPFNNPVLNNQGAPVRATPEQIQSDIDAAQGRVKQSEALKDPANRSMDAARAAAATGLPFGFGFGN